MMRDDNFQYELFHIADDMVSAVEAGRGMMGNDNSQYELFTCDIGSNLMMIEDSAPFIHTLMGEIGLFLQINHKFLQPDISHVLTTSAGLSRLFRWQMPEIDAELLICRPKQNPNYPVDDLWVGVWRIIARKDTGSIEFSCKLETISGLDNGGSESGENLNAVSWYSATSGRFLFIGTEDEDAIAGNRMPKRLPPMLYEGSFGQKKKYSPEEKVQFVFTNNEVRTIIPGLAIDETFQTHFAIAWGNDSFEVWSAVDVDQRRLLANSGCK